MGRVRDFNATCLIACLGILVAFGAPLQAQAANKKPNILVIWGDDIGITNISAYSRGLMGYQTPNIDRIANEGAIFTDCPSSDKLGLISV